MTISHLLEDFGGEAETKESTIRFMTEDELEDVRLAAFEQGYSAGWEDASVAQTRDHKRISAEMATRLEDLSFTYHEASVGILTALEPIFSTLVDKVLPEALSELFGHQILAEMNELAKNASGAPVTITVPPGLAVVVEAPVPPNLSMPVQVVESPALQDGQADLKVGSDEREIDCASLSNAFRDAVAAFFHQINKDVQNA